MELWPRENNNIPVSLKILRCGIERPPTLIYCIRTYLPVSSNILWCKIDRLHMLIYCIHHYLHTSLNILLCKLKSPTIMLYYRHDYLPVSLKILWCELNIPPIILYCSHHYIPIYFQIIWCVLEVPSIMTPRSLQFLKDCLKDVIVLLHIDIWCKLEQPVIVRRSAGSTQFLKDGSDNNTSLASLRFLKVVIAILLISLYRNSTKGGSCLEDEREIGEEIFCQQYYCKARGWCFSVDTAPIQLTCCVSRLIFYGSTVIGVYIH